MVLLRFAFYEFALCIHVIGAAVLFRRLFPRESPWLCFLLPILIVLTVLNFTEHFIALPNLGWLFPLTTGGAIWCLLRPDNRWLGLRFPAILFVATFTFIFCMRSLVPDISNNGEGIFNMTRILNYCLGGTLPPEDSFLPPYEYGAYYSFQHYGAAILRRLFFTDLGTAYNISYAFLLSWVCLIGAGVAHSITGKKWIAVAMVVILLGSWTGSGPFLMFLHPDAFDFGLSTNLNDGWNEPHRNPFSWICAHDPAHPFLLLQPPLINFYWPEFHSTLGGNFVTIATMLACSEVFKAQRTCWPWICLVAFPLLVIVTCAWFFFIVAFFCAGSLIFAAMTGRRPENWKFVCVVSGLAVIFFWPFVFSVTGISGPQEFYWTVWKEHTPIWMFLVQWWPVFLPWLFLCFVWNKLDWRARWIHAAIPILFLGLEFVTFGDRKLTTEKMWAGMYGVGLVTLVPLVFLRPGVPFRILTGIILFLSPLCLMETISTYYPYPSVVTNFAHLQGDDWVNYDDQKRRLLQVMRQFHGVTILPGKSYWNYSQAAAVVAFSENLCFVAYTFNEFHYGHGAEADFRSEINNKFYDGKIADPLSFLRGNNITAVLIWPEDEISDQLLAQFKQQLGPEFFYIDCKMTEPNNAGLFIRQSDLNPFPGMIGYSPEK